VWQLGFIARFFWLILVYSGQSFTRLNLTIRELYFSGVLSLLIILVSGLFVGLVLGLQGYEILQRYGSSDSMGTMVALSLLRELGPVVAGLLFASRAGSAVTAEIGLMKVTEQLKAMDMMAVSPIARVVAPRFWGGVISMPLLAAMFSTMGIFGGWLIGVVFIGIDDGAFWSQMQAAVDFRYDVLNGVIKSCAFGVAVSLIAVFQGYDCVPTAEGVSRAITRTVVSSALAILALDFVMTSSCSEVCNESYDARPVGRDFRGDGYRRTAVSGSQGRQYFRFGNPLALYPHRPLRQHWRPQGARTCKELRSAGRSCRADPLR